MRLPNTFATLAALFAFAGSAQAETAAFELYVGDVRLPLTVNGSVTFRECAIDCAYKRALLASDATFEVNGRTMNFDKFRDAVSRVGKDKDITVLLDEDKDRITLISLYVERLNRS